MKRYPNYPELTLEEEIEFNEVCIAHLIQVGRDETADQIRKINAQLLQQQRKVNMPNTNTGPFNPNPPGGAPPMPGPGVPVVPGQPSPAGAELPGFQTYVQAALCGILANPHASLEPTVVDSYTQLAILYARSYLKHVANQ